MNIYLFLRNKCSWKYEWNESSDSCRFFAPLGAVSFLMKPQEVKPKAQTDWLGFCKA